MGAIIVTVVFFAGLALAIICGTLSAARKNPLWYSAKVAYALGVNVLYAGPS